MATAGTLRSQLSAGLARFHGMPALVVGHQKGRDTKQRQYRNFGCLSPKAIAKRFAPCKLGRKIRKANFLCFIDTPPGISGHRPQSADTAEAIDYNTARDGS